VARFNLVAIALLLGCTFLPWQVICFVVLSEFRLSWYKKHIPQVYHWERCPGSSFLGASFVIQTGHSINPCFTISSCVLLYVHFLSYCTHTSLSMSITIMLLYQNSYLFLL